MDVNPRGATSMANGAANAPAATTTVKNVSHRTKAIRHFLKHWQDAETFGVRITRAPQSSCIDRLFRVPLMPETVLTATTTGTMNGCIRHNDEMAPQESGHTQTQCSGLGGALRCPKSFSLGPTRSKSYDRACQEYHRGYTIGHVTALRRRPV